MIPIMLWPNSVFGRTAMLTKDIYTTVPWPIYGTAETGLMPKIPFDD